MGLLDAVGRFGHKIVNGIDTAAYNSLGGGLLGAALPPQQMPPPQMQPQPQQPQGGLLGVVGDGATDDNPMQTGQDPTTGRPSILSGNQPQQQTAQPAPPPQPQQWTPDAQQRSQLRSQWLMGIGGALSKAGAGQPLDLGGAMQQYQQNAVGQIQAGQQAALAQQHQQMLGQFQREVSAAGSNPQALQSIAAKWAPYFPTQVKDLGEAIKSLTPKESVYKPIGDIGYLNEGTGEFKYVNHPGKELSPDQQAFAGFLQANNGDAVAAYRDYMGVKTPPKDPKENKLADNTLLDMRSQGMTTGDERIDAFTPQQAGAALQRLKPAPGSVVNNYGPAQDGAANPAIGAMARYEIPVPTPRSSSPASVAEYNRLITAIRKENPHYDATTFPAAQKTINDFTSGKSAASINAINTAAGHLGVLAQAAKALDSGDLTLMNRIANAYGLATGNDKLSVYKTIVHRLAPEITRSYVGAGGGEGDRVANESDFDPMLGTKRILANAGVTANLYNSKINALGHQFEHGAPGRKFEGFITPEAQGVFDSLRAPQQNGQQSDMIPAQIPGQPPGKIHRAQRAQFLIDHPGAQVGQ